MKYPMGDPFLVVGAIVCFVIVLLMGVSFLITLLIEKVFK